MSSYVFFLILFMGMAGMISLYLLITYFLIKDISYLFYSLSIFCVVLSVGYRLWLADTGLDSIENPYRFFLFPALQVSSHLFYFLFASRFLDMRRTLPKLNKFFSGAVWLLLVYLIASAIICFLFKNLQLNNTLYIILRIGLIAFAVGSVIYAVRKDDKLIRLFCIGTILMVLSATISFVFDAFKIYPPLGEILRAPFSYFLIGYLLDIVFFTFCLGYKNQLEQREKFRLQEQLLIQTNREQQGRMALILQTQEAERKRVSNDLHDDLGAGLSTIRFLSEVAKASNKTSKFTEIEKISNLASDLVDSLRQIIWSMNPENNSLKELIEFIHYYAAEYFDSNALSLRIVKPESDLSKIIPGEARRNIFLTVKEAMHNVVKHASAKNVKVEIIADSVLKVIISDDGIGMMSMEANPGTLQGSGNGLKNMSRRMEQVGGKFSISRDKGTIVTIEYPLG